MSLEYTVEACGDCPMIEIYGRGTSNPIFRCRVLEQDVTRYVEDGLYPEDCPIKIENGIMINFEPQEKP